MPALPDLLAPVQIKILPISEKHLAYCQDVAKKMEAKGIRVESMKAMEKLGYKIRKAQMGKSSLHGRRRR